MIIHVSLPNAASVVTHLLYEEDGYMYVEYPVIFVREEMHIYTLPYMPFADKGKVQINKSSVIAVAKAHKDIEKHYKEVVKHLKKQKLVFSKQADNTTQEMEDFLANLVKSKLYH